MRFSLSARALHRALSVVFTGFVLANFAVMPLGNETLGMAVGGLTVLPLLLLMGSGLYLFVRPYLRARTVEAE